MKEVEWLPIRPFHDNGLSFAAEMEAIRIDILRSMMLPPRMLDPEWQPPVFEFGDGSRWEEI